MKLEKIREDGSAVFKAVGTVLRLGETGAEGSAIAETAVSGRLILRPLQTTG